MNSLSEPTETDEIVVEEPYTMELVLDEVMEKKAEENAAAMAIKAADEKAAEAAGVVNLDNLRIGDHILLKAGFDGVNQTPGFLHSDGKWK